MKKISTFLIAILSTFSAFAYYDSYSDYGLSNYASNMNDFMRFNFIVMIVYIILSIVVLVRWWKMTTNVNKIRKVVSRTDINTDLCYLVAIGEKKEAEKVALKILVDILYNIYNDPYSSKVAKMNREIETHLSKIRKLDLTIPEYVTSGEKFIQYMNELTGYDVPCE